MLTYVENENHHCEGGNGKYWCDLFGHQAIICVWPRGLQFDGEPFVTIDLLNGSAPDDCDDPCIYTVDLSDPADHLLEAVLQFHEAVVKGIVEEQEVFEDFLLIPLGLRLAEGMAMDLHEQARGAES